MTSLSLYEDLLGPGEVLALPAGARIVYVASGELAGLHAGSAAFGTDEAELRAGGDGATVLRWELTEWSVDDAKLSAPVDLDPWGDYALRCERDGEPPARQGIGCVLRGELLVDGERVQPFGAFVAAGGAVRRRPACARHARAGRRAAGRRTGAGPCPPLIVVTR